MLNYYQPWLPPFLKATPDQIPAPLKQIYYYSFEDGLWDVLKHKFPDRNVTFLVPDFYCSNVLDNIMAHGHNYIYYPLDRNFQISSSEFRRYLWLYQPEIVIIFHACGITSNLFRSTSWLSDLPADSVIIEDAVHRLLNPQQIKLIAPRHLVIDSLRKVSPLPGSRLIGLAEFLNFSPPSRRLNAYFYKSIFYYLLFRMFLKVGFLLNSSCLISWSHQVLLKNHDEIIGDSSISQPGLSLFSHLTSHLNYPRLAKFKKEQASHYQKYLTPLFKHKKFFQIHIPKSDYPHLHVYPLGIISDPKETLPAYLNALGFPVWYKFTDTPWSQHRQVLFLPLGFHVTEKSINNLTNALHKYK